jgi:hypothetical protein
LQYVDRHNSGQDKQVSLIGRQGFYDTWWAKGLTAFAYLVIAAALIIRVIAPERVSIWKLVQLLCISVVWLSAYYINRRSRKP